MLFDRQIGAPGKDSSKIINILERKNGANFENREKTGLFSEKKVFKSTIRPRNMSGQLVLCYLLLGTFTSLSLE